MGRLPNRLVLNVVLQALEIALWTAAFLLAAVIGIAILESGMLSESELFEAFPDAEVPVVEAASQAPSRSPSSASAARRRAAPRAPRKPAAGSLIGRLEAPSVQLTVAVREGTSARTLLRGAGRISHTSLPGQRGNVGIAGHRDTVFRPLRLLKPGDPLTLTTADRVMKYKVTKIWVVSPKTVSVLNATRRPALTLVTCYPFYFIGSAPQRYIVRAELVEEQVRGRSSTARSD